ncbi:MAG: YceI family protein [Lacisediminihabitans sp.]
MKKKTKVALWIGGGLVALGGIALFVGPYAYAGYVASVVSAPPSLDPTAAASAATVDADHLSGTWKVGKGSFAGYRVKEVLLGRNATVTGRTSNVTGSLTAQGLTLTAATISVDVGSIATTEPARDAYFRDTALQVSQFPTATFALTDPVRAVRPTPGRPQSFTARGELMLHGVTKTVTVTLDAALTKDGAQVTGSIPITFSDFGVQAPGLGFVTVEGTGSVEFLLDLTQK